MLVVCAVSLLLCKIVDQSNVMAAGGTTLPDSAAVKTEELTLDGYENRTDGKVFDAQILQDLYKKLTGNANAAIGTVGALGTQNSADFRGRNNGKDVVVTLGGKEWVATYLTTNRQGQIILDLWYADASYTTQWSAFFDTTVYHDYTAMVNLFTYPQNMYSTSLMRSVGLNNVTSGYVASQNDTSLTAVSQNPNHLFAKFTMPNGSGVTGSLVGFIDKPANVAYQETEYRSYMGYPSGGNGDDYVIMVNDMYSDSHGLRNRAYNAKSGYNDWKNDYIWLPSHTEISAGSAADPNASSTCEWKISASAMLLHGSASSELFVRSSYVSPSTGNFQMRLQGIFLGGTTITGDTPRGDVAHTTRPAFHFNLTKAAAAAADRMVVPQDVTTTYTGEEFGIGDISPAPSWYTTDFADSVDITYPDNAAGLETVGTYTVKATIKTTQKDIGMKFAGTPDASKGEDEYTRIFTVTVERKKVKVPYLASYSSDYNGVDQDFTLLGDFDKDVVTATAPAGTTFDDATGKITVKDAGEYDFKFDLVDQDNYSWEGPATDTAQKTFPSGNKLKINRKKLKVTFNSSTNAWLWEAGGTGTISATEDSLASDTVELDLYYYNDDTPTSKIPVTQPFDVSALAVGSYHVGAELDDTKGDNKNYEIDGTAERAFSISNAGAEISSVDWYYTVKGEEKDVTDPTLKVKYNGSQYVLSIKSDDLASKGVKIDTTYNQNGYVNGYLNATGTNAMSATTAKVRIVPMDGFQFASGTFKEFELTWEIEKADYDLTNAAWSADELTYKGTAHTVTLTGLPTGLTVASYSGQTATAVGDYTAKVVSFNNANSTNYNTPDVTDPLFTHDWKIVKIKLTVSWDYDEQQDDENKAFFVPVLDSNNDKVEYTYYKDDNGSPSTEEVNLSDIQVDESNVTKYWVKVSIKSSYAASYELIDDSGTVPFYMSFDVGDNKTPVSVGLQVKENPYNTSAQPVVLEITSDVLTQADFEIEYFVKNADGTKGDKLDGAPVAAGDYIVSVNLPNEDYTLKTPKEFEYSITKAKFDLSQLVWQDGDGNEYAKFTYEYGATQSVSLSAMQIAGEGSDLLEIAFDPDAVLSAADAGKYTVKLLFTYDEDNYEAPAFADVFEWEIEQATPDLSEVHWNYENEFVYEMGEDGAVNFEVALEGLPDGVKEFVKYVGTASKNDVGSFSLKFELDENHPLYKNYKDLNFGNLPTEITWKVVPRKYEKPTKQELVYKGEAYDLLELCAFPEGWEKYLKIQVNGAVVDPNDPATYELKSKGSYKVVIEYLDGMNKSSGGTEDRVIWTDGSNDLYRFDVEISAYVITVNGWYYDTSTRVRPEVQFGSEAQEGFYVITTRDADGKEVTGALAWNTNYTIEISVAPEHAGSVIVTGKDGDDTLLTFGFRTPADPTVDIEVYEKPSFKTPTVTYNGKTQTFELDGFDAETMEFTAESDGLEQKNAGEYTVTLRFKSGAAASWKTEDGSVDTSEITITFVIEKLMLRSEWDSTGERPVLTLPEGMEGVLEIEYEYYDADGNKADASQLSAGKTYEVRAVLKDENVAFVDEAGAELATPLTSEGFSFTIPNGPSGPDWLPEGFPLWQIIVIIVCLILFIILMILAAKKRKEKKAAEAEIKKYKDEMEQLDEDISD